MGLADELHYALVRPNAAQRLVRRVAATAVGSRLLRHLITPADTLTVRLTHGRRTVSEALSAIPVLDLTTTGRRSGQQRTTPLLAIPVGDGLGIVGTNFGRTSAPGWVHNLEADPRARLTYRGVSVAVRARPADAAERSVILAGAEQVYRGYVRYQAAITGRPLAVFVLERTDGP